MSGSDREKLLRCRVHAKQRRNRSETSNPHITKVSFNHYVLRQFCDFDKDSKIEETIFNHIQNKKEDKLHALLRKVFFNLPRVVLIRYCTAETKGDRF